ncbi:MAG: hypothetical protein WCW26_01285 [Candidatus Buchananbacteria bacterium]
MEKQEIRPAEDIVAELAGVDCAELRGFFSALIEAMAMYQDYEVMHVTRLCLAASGSISGPDLYDRLCAEYPRPGGFDQAKVISRWTMTILPIVNLLKRVGRI